MALVLVNKDGSSNAKPGDTVVHGGGMTTIHNDGTKTTIPLPGVGSTKNYSTVVDIMNKITKDSSSWATGGSRKRNNNATRDVSSPATSAVKTFDSEENYDNFTTPGSGLNDYYCLRFDPMSAVNGTIPNYSGNGGVKASNIVGYGIIGLVLIAVLDKLIG
ncbi:MAG: hypothetical protein ACK5MV_05225 [Aminipila sp.]